MSTTDATLEAVREIVADVLSLDVEEVHPSDRFEQDLGGESVDLLDVFWQCEKRFGVKVSIPNLFPEEMLSTDQSGVLTPAALAALRRALPFLEYERIGDNPRRERLNELLTVEAIAHFIRRGLAEQADVPSSAGPSVQPA